MIGECSNLVFVLCKRKLFCVDPIGGNLHLDLSFLSFDIQSKHLFIFWWFLFSLELF